MPPIEIQMVGVRIVIYILCYWMLLKALTGRYLRTAVYVTVMTLSSTVFRLVCELRPYVAFERDRRRFSVLLTNMSCAQSPLRAHHQQFILRLPV